MTNIALAKFRNDPSAKQALLSTGTSRLLEATNDNFFGCGLPIYKVKGNLDALKGKNVLGHILEKIQQDLTLREIRRTRPN